MTNVLVCLHGWGGDKSSFTELRSALQGKAITILTPDLPGFGSEPEPRTPWTTDDFTDWVTLWIQKQLSSLQLPSSTPIFLLGHSHGGRIALKLACRQSKGSQADGHIRHLFLCAAAGIRHPRHWKRIIGLTLAKAGAFFLSIPGLRALQPVGKKLLYKLVRVHDYEKASTVMRQTLINVSREDVRATLKDIRIPTDIFWGKDDGMTPYEDALVMQRSIQGSILHSYSGIRHRVHRDKAPEIATVICARMGL